MRLLVLTFRDFLEHMIPVAYAKIKQCKSCMLGVFVREQFVRRTQTTPNPTTIQTVQSDAFKDNSVHPALWLHAFPRDPAFGNKTAPHIQNEKQLKPKTSQNPPISTLQKQLSPTSLRIIRSINKGAIVCSEHNRTDPFHVMKRF
jgi:hypothetical protein